MTRTLPILLLILLLTLSLPLAAEVTHQDENGFEVRHTITVDKDPMMIHRTLTAHVDQWWVSSHTYSGDSANLSIDLKKGGGLYEDLPSGGMVEHLRLLYFAPLQEYRWDGALGPLQPMETNGRLSWTIKPVEGGNSITFSYKVWGNPPGGLANWATPVDGMMKETITSLEKRLSRD